MAFHFHQGVVPGGYLGVQLFFVLSGYLITGLLVAEISRTNGIALKAFWMRRLLRLYPALVAAVALTLLITAVVGHRGSTTSDIYISAVASLLYVNDFARAVGIENGWLDVTWSLGVEEQFYLVWPFVILFALRRRSSADLGRLCLITATAFFVLVAVSRVLVGFEATYFSPIGSIAPLLLGAAIALQPPRASRALTVGAGMAAVVLAVLAVLGPDLESTVAYFGPQQVGIVAAAVLTAHVVAANGPQLLAHPVLVWIGRRSYGLYLYHQLIRLTVQTLFPDWRATFLTAVALPVTFAVAALSYRYIETPFLRRKQRFARVPGEVATEGNPAGDPAVPSDRT